MLEEFEGEYETLRGWWVAGAICSSVDELLINDPCQVSDMRTGPRRGIRNRQSHYPSVISDGQVFRCRSSGNDGFLSKSGAAPSGKFCSEYAAI